MKKPKNFLITIFIIAGIYWVLQKNNVIPSLKDIFTPKPVVIDETPIVLKQIKSIGQLITYVSYDEVVADTTILTRGSAFVNGFNRLSPVPLLPSADKQLVLVSKGKVLAGIDLSLLADNNITVEKDTVAVILPKATIIETIVNPSDFEIFLERGQLTNQEVTLVKLKARRKLEARALQQNILEKADAKAKAVLRNFLQSMGYKKVEVY
jgi:hypothetical protein